MNINNVDCCDNQRHFKVEMFNIQLMLIINEKDYINELIVSFFFGL